MKLQILVPQYNEDESVIKTLLDSIEIQQSVDLKNDVGMIIVNDGSDIHLSNKFFENYTYPIEYYVHQHRGVSATRNACLDYATADYVMWCDCDDCFMNACGLWMIFEQMKKGFDSLISTFIEQNFHPETKEPLYVTRERDNIFVHGKVHRRQYLIDQNIRWNDNLTIHEDSYFNTLCQALTKDLLYISTPFYLWRWRDASVCRHDPKYRLKTYGNLIDSNDALVDEFLRRGKVELAQSFSTMMIFDAYYTMNKPEWIDQENKEYRDEAEERFAKYFKDNKFLWDEIDIKRKMMISNNVRTRIVGEGMQMETITIDQWLDDKC